MEGLLKHAMRQRVQPARKRNAPWSLKARTAITGVAGVVAGLRFYSPGIGRWLSRDPIGERGGLNLQAFCANSSTLLVDAIGLKMLRVISEATGKPCYIDSADLERLTDYVELSEVAGVVDNGLAASSWLDKVTGKAGEKISQNKRYIYVVGNGWVDLQHVTSSLAVPGAQYGMGFDLGLWLEAKQWVQGLLDSDSATSAFSPEDITSNWHCAIFVDRLSP